MMSVRLLRMLCFPNIVSPQISPASSINIVYSLSGAGLGKSKLSCLVSITISVFRLSFLSAFPSSSSSAEPDLIIASLLRTGTISQIFKGNLLRFPCVREYSIFWGMLSPKNVFKLSSRSLLFLSRRIIRLSPRDRKGIVRDDLQPSNQHVLEVVC
jgi:hypothetical protein